MRMTINSNDTLYSSHSLKDHSESLTEIKEDFLALLLEVNRSEKLVWTMLTQVREGLQTFIKGPLMELLENAVCQATSQGISQQKFMTLKKKSHSHFCHRKQLAQLLNFMEEEGFKSIYTTQLLKIILNEANHNPPRFSKAWKQLLRHRLISLMLFKFEQLRRKPNAVFNVLDLWYKLFPDISICDIIDERFKNKQQLFSQKQSSHQAAFELDFLEKEFSKILKLEELEEKEAKKATKQQHKQKTDTNEVIQTESNCHTFSQQMNSEISGGWNIINTNHHHLLKESQKLQSNFHQEQIATDMENLGDRVDQIQIEQESSEQLQFQHSPMKQQQLFHSNSAAPNNENSFLNLQTPVRDSQSMMPLHDSTNLRLAYESATDKKSIKCFSAVQASSKYVNPQTTPFASSPYFPPIIHQHPSYQKIEAEQNSIGASLFIPIQ